MSVATSTAIAVGVSVAASTAAAAMKSKADKKSAQAANSANYNQYLESRGAGGNAILPMYADDGTEKRLFDEAVAAYDAGLSGQTPDEVVDNYRSILAQMEPSIAAGNQTIDDIYNGNLQREALAYQDPVNKARTAMADTQGTSAMQALAYERNRLAAEEARKGYSGSGSFANNRLLDSAIGSRQMAAMARATAGFENAKDVADINRGAQGLRVQSLDLAPKRAEQLIALDGAPAEGLARLQLARTKPLDFFRLNPGNPPPVQPVPSTGAGQLVLQGAGQLAGAAGNVFATNQAAENLKASTAADRAYQLELLRMMQG